MPFGFGALVSTGHAVPSASQGSSSMTSLMMRGYFSDSQR